MPVENPEVDAYLADGCGRCPLGGTPECKVHNWEEELRALRKTVLGCGLTEERKWGVPCYTHQSKNVLIIGAFKEFCSLNFFKGALMHDPYGVLEMPGENSQSARIIRFTKGAEIKKMAPKLKILIQEAIRVEDSGEKVAFKSISEHAVPEELQQKLDSDPEFRAAFEALTPGRQRGYLIHFSAPKQAKTRVSRIEKCVPQIMAGKGMHDR